ncbi:energy transducer TonB [Croceivirga thetidis]|uniref:Energy transducer TonB n=1 Tax=Croceivirga thetidis TaxID=2721623 RepID=A0ABX1GNY3_9FLAO|nr:energy transducer TonB [Croceivirga thetidis]NKI31279.1 energy transducer TonB [Croceivirga thetidis]
MEPKKNPELEVNRNSSLYFMIGLTISLFLTWQLLEYKTYDSEGSEFVNELNVLDDFKEEVPITQQLNTPPPPPPPSAPALIEIVDNIEEVEETVITSTESNQNTFIEDVIVDLDAINVEEVEEDLTVPFAVIEHVPVFPGCEHLKSEAEKKACFNEKIQKHIQENFNYPETALEMGISGRVFLQFHIDATGKVVNIQKRGPDRLLEDEAVRIIAALPLMKPGTQRGKPTKVGYSIPINFVMQ